MAQARMLRKEICESDSFASLKDSDSQLLLCLLTPWWSDHGKMIGEPVWIKGNIVRKLRQFTEKRIIKCLNLINLHTDVHFWTDEKGNRWLYWPKFDNHQSISKEKKAKDTYPSPKIPKNPQKKPVIREVNIREDKKKGILGKNGLAAQDIYSYYSKTIKPGAKEDAIKNINNLLKTGFSKEDLLGRINAYAKQLKETGKQDKQYYIQANNFFGEKARFKDYEPIKIVTYEPPNPNCKACKGSGRLQNGEGQIVRCGCVKEAP